MQKIVKVSDTEFKVLSSNGKDYYDVNLNDSTCTCVGYKTRKRCRHLVEVLTLQNEVKDNSYEDIIRELKEPMSVSDFVTKYDDKTLEDLKSKGVVFVSNGYVKLI